MVRATGKPKASRAPSVRGVESVYENYAIITKYHGGAHRYCDVMAHTVDKGNSEIVSIKRVRLKGSITRPKSKQRIVVGHFVLLQYGEIALIYDSNTSNIVPLDIRRLLDSNSGTNDSKDEISFNSESEEEDEPSDEDEEATESAVPKTADLDCI